jgi:hypothetical protein
MAMFRRKKKNTRPTPRHPIELGRKSFRLFVKERTFLGLDEETIGYFTSNELADAYRVWDEEHTNNKLTTYHIEEITTFDSLSDAKEYYEYFHPDTTRFQ